MTRFARASGSKGSNEKQPEDATSWHELKASMEASTSRQAERSQEETCETTEDGDVPTIDEIQNVWAQLVSESDNKSTKKKLKVKKTEEPKTAEVIKETKKKNKKNAETKEKLKPAKKKRIAEESDNQDSPVKKKKRKLTADPAPEGPTDKTKKLKLFSLLDKGNEKVTDVKPKEKKRRKEALKPNELIINGKPVQVAPFDGFLVQAEDAARLKELRKSMKAKKIPDDERERAIKLERRRAEKALARLRKRVCFHCRSTGHNLSECPQIAEEQRVTGICYKCGSTEHTHFQCKVSRGDDFKFAECFICKEQGHIAKQCPDNPRGLYPRGGGCATCGDVTHLKKDCPKYLAEKEDDVTVNTRNDWSLEALEEDVQVKKSTPIRGKKFNKRIKF